MSDISRQKHGAGLSVIDFKPVDGPGSQRGFLDIYVPSSRLRVIGCPVHESHGRHWAALPGKPQIDKAGQAVPYENTGKPGVPAASHRVSASALSLARSADYGQA